MDNPWRASVRVLGLYLKASVLIFACQLALYAVGFGLSRLPLWALLAVICAVSGLVPRIGGLIGIGLVLLIAGVGGANLWQLAIAAGIWIVVQAVEGFWLTPRLLGKPLGLGPLALFAALLVGSFALGPVGFFLAAPLLGVAMVWVRYFRGKPTLPARGGGNRQTLDRR